MGRHFCVRTKLPGSRIFTIAVASRQRPWHPASGHGILAAENPAAAVAIVLSYRYQQVGKGYVSRMAIIDFHLHAFPDHLASRALDALSRTGGGLVPCFDGTLSGLKTLLQAQGIQQGVVLTIATKPGQEDSVNRFAIENNTPDLMFFGSVHPHSKQIPAHLRELKAAGIRGIKFHPEYQRFSVDDPAMLPIYRLIAEMGFITVFHAGLDVGFDVPGRCRPAALARILPAFAGAPVVAAHFGGYMLWDEVERELVGKPIYLDTAYSHSRVLIPQVTRMIHNHGADRILFGSDAPWSNPGLECGLIQRLDIPSADKHAILEGNARRLLGFPERPTHATSGEAGGRKPAGEAGGRGGMT